MRKSERASETDRQRQRETGVGVGGEQTKQLLDFTECYVNQRADTHIQTHTHRYADTDIQTHRHTDS